MAVCSVSSDMDAAESVEDAVGSDPHLVFGADIKSSHIINFISRDNAAAVSYTHLTLPTKAEV